MMAMHDYQKDPELIKKCYKKLLIHQDMIQIQ